MRLLCSVLLVLGLASPGAARAQSFLWRSLSGERPVTLTIDTSTEFIHDPFTLGARYASDLRMRRRILANPYVRAARITYPTMDLRAVVTGGANDTVEFRWYDGIGGSSVTGLHSWLAQNVVSYTPSGGTTYSATNPGFRWQFSSGPSAPPIQPFPDPNSSEGAGLQTSTITLIGTGAVGRTQDAILAAHELVTGVVMATDDTVRFRLPAAITTPVTVALWLQNPSSGVQIWARCGGPPNASTYSYTRATGTLPGQQGAFLDLPVCSTVWYFAVTNTSASDRVFHLTWGTHYPSRRYIALKVGISWTMTPTELAALRASFREAAWRVYGAFGGTLIIGTLQYYNNANTCDDGLPAELFSCGNQLCDFCLQPSCSASNYDPNVGNITLCNGDWLSPTTIAHEIGHDQGGLLDEYGPFGGPCPMNGNYALCWHSMMASLSENQNSLCNAVGHRAAVSDWRGRDLINSIPAVIPGPTGYSCSGATMIYTSASSAWDAVAPNAPIDHPTNISPHNVWYPQFINHPDYGIGWPIN